jgi:hypothetical protein
MGRLLFVVEDTFMIRGRGLMTLPGIKLTDDERFTRDDPILLKRPDGTAKRWCIGGVEMPMTPAPRLEYPVLLEGLEKDDVPIGTEVWSVDREEGVQDWNA